MAASAKPSGNNQERSGNGNGATNNGSSVAHDNSVVGPTQAALRHNPGLATDWTAEEQYLLEELLNKYASERNIFRYAKIAMQLKDKTVRDVALRCRWMSKKENGKRRKEDYNSARKNKDKKEKVTDPMAKSASHAANRSNGPPYAQTMIPMDSDDGISYKAIGGVTGQLLEQNAQALDQISANFAAFKIQENINLFCQARNNILTILNDTLKFEGFVLHPKEDGLHTALCSDQRPNKLSTERGHYVISMNDLPEIMKQMPPLPVKLNEELANSILPRLSLQKDS